MNSNSRQLTPTSTSTGSGKEWIGKIMGVLFYLVLIAFVLIVLPLLCSIGKDKHLTEEGTHVDIDEVVRDAKQGDLLGTSAPILYTYLIQIFTQSIWSHVAIVVEESSKTDTDDDDVEKYVVEIGRKGFYRTPLRSWLQKSKNIVWCPLVADGEFSKFHDIRGVRS